MWNALIIVYVAVAIILVMALLYLLCSSWNELSEEEKYMEYLEGAGEGLIATRSFFAISLLAAAPWPFLPMALIGVWVYGKIAEKYPVLCRMGEGEEDEPERDC